MKMEPILINGDFARIIDEWGLCNTDYVPQHEVGERLILPNGWVFQYGKVDFGNKIAFYKWINVPL